MPVTSEPIKRKQSAIVSRATLDRQRGAFERLMAAGLLFVSFAGTIAALSGGWAALLADPRPGQIAAGVTVQCALTAAEWWYGAGRGRWRYRLALAIDTALTAIGYGPLIAPWLTPYIAGKGVSDLAPAIAWGIIVVASALLAWYPEMTLID
jgi:hypothetical protein